MLQAIRPQALDTGTLEGRVHLPEPDVPQMPPCMQTSYTQHWSPASASHHPLWPVVPDTMCLRATEVRCDLTHDCCGHKIDPIDVECHIAIGDVEQVWVERDSHGLERDCSAPDSGAGWQVGDASVCRPAKAEACKNTDESCLRTQRSFLCTSSGAYMPCFGRYCLYD